MPYKGWRKNPLVRFTAAKLRIFKRLRKPPHGKPLIFNTYSAARLASERRSASKVFHSSFPLPPSLHNLPTLLLCKGVAVPPRPASPAIFHTNSGSTRQLQNRTYQKIKSLTFQSGRFLPFRGLFYNVGRAWQVKLTTNYFCQRKLRAGRDSQSKNQPNSSIKKPPNALIKISQIH